MPMYGFRCPACQLEFEVSRPMKDAGNPASCPMDGRQSDRIFTAPVTIGGRRSAPEEAAAPAAPPRPGGISHYGHSHGFGGGGHSHGPRMA